LIEIINKPLLLHLVGYLYYWQMGFNSVFKGLMWWTKVLSFWRNLPSPNIAKTFRFYTIPSPENRINVF